MGARDAVSVLARVGRLAPTLILAGLATAGVAIAGGGVALAESDNLAPATSAAVPDPAGTEVNYSHVLRRYDDVQVRYDNPFYQ